MSEGEGRDDKVAVRRRTRPSKLREVIREVEEMEKEGVKGPVFLLQARLAARGVLIGEAALRSGDCRAYLERVWKRRKPSIVRYGPTGGYDLLPVPELVERILDAEARLARVEADLRGEVMQRPERRRDPRSVAVCELKDQAVAARAALIPRAIADVAKTSSTLTFAKVAKRLGELGHPITCRQLRRVDVYSRPIWKAKGVAEPAKVADPRRRALMNESSEKLGALLFGLVRELRKANERFEATL